jgi:hypothetical protein
MKSYELNLPVFKQGDDLHHCITQNPGDLRAAFEQQACNYNEAARLCRRMAGVAAEVPDLEVYADTHHIGVDGPVGRLESLVNEEILTVVEHDDEFDEEGEEAGDEEGEEEGGEFAGDDDESPADESGAP